MGIFAIVGTSTGVGKTVVTAAVAALAQARGQRVAVVKPAQIGLRPGEPGDLATIERLVPGVATYEYARYPDVLSPEAAARYAGDRPLRLTTVAKSLAALDTEFDLVLVEGTGGVLTRFGPDGWTMAELAWSMQAPAVVVTAAGRGTLNHTALTLEALRARGIPLAGLMIGRWPDEPDLTARSNLADLEALSGRPLDGALPENAAGPIKSPGFPDAGASLARLLEMAGRRRERSAPFEATARAGLSPAFGGTFDGSTFRDDNTPEPAGTCAG
ncbi:dethiobiotin synthase [Cryptosporangium phraense]|uniref:dethiobiotin synthase n=1 Tax=Cryptosporangium phraense TaxID=2593070 RepID=UPI00197AF37A|nr:dethiobiotin synthase [Cryptosporangium phraense]